MLNFHIHSILANFSATPATRSLQEALCCCVTWGGHYWATKNWSSNEISLFRTHADGVYKCDYCFKSFDRKDTFRWWFERSFIFKDEDKHLLTIASLHQGPHAKPHRREAVQMPLLWQGILEILCPHKTWEISRDQVNIEFRLKWKVFIFQTHHLQGGAYRGE